MTDLLTNALLLSVIGLLGLLLWVLSIALVLRDVTRRGLPGYEQGIWLLLAALLPILGGLTYLFSRALDRIFSPAGQSQPSPKKRVTASKRADRPGRRLPTVAAVDTYRQTVAEISPDIRADLEKKTAARLVLEVQTGPETGLKYSITMLPVRIGRGPLATLSLEGDQGISRRHAEIYENAGLLRVRDLKSTHGTYLNGKRIQDESLNPGDQLKVGLSTLVLNLEDFDGTT